MPEKRFVGRRSRFVGGRGIYYGVVDEEGVDEEGMAEEWTGGRFGEVESVIGDIPRACARVVCISSLATAFFGVLGDGGK